MRYLQFSDIFWRGILSDKGTAYHKVFCIIFKTKLCFHISNKTPRDFSMASSTETTQLAEKCRSVSPSHQEDVKDDLHNQSEQTSHHKNLSETDTTISNREKKLLKRKAQKEQWKAKKRQKKAAILDQGGSTNNKEPNFSQEDLDETSYYFENGLRKVYPYYFKFSMYTKGRWLKRKLVDILTEEFRAWENQQYINDIEKGNITVNGKTITTDYTLNNGDLVQHLVHRHESPVSSQKIEILCDTEEFLVVNKPPSIPIHPCGRYRHNSLVYILGKEQAYRNLRGTHRLDRLTSGVVIFCKTHKKANEVSRTIVGREVEKVYLSRVEGEFPSGTVICEQPLDSLCHKLGLQRVSPKGKSAKTVFERINYNGTSSVVKCTPHTGRTHQIRVHLQYLGHPIINDVLYNTDAWGPNKGKGAEFGMTDEQLLEGLMKHHTPLNHIDRAISTDVDPRSLPHPEGSTFEVDKLTVDERCPECKMHYKEPQPEELVMYLHAYRYKGPGFEFKTEIPHWAKEDWKK